MDIQLKVTLQWSEELSHLWTEVTHRLMEVFRQVMLAVSVMLQDQVREVEMTLEEASRSSDTPHVPSKRLRWGT